MSSREDPRTTAGGGPPVFTSQIAAFAIGIVVFIGLITPGLTRYVLFGGAMLFFANAALFGGLDATLHHFYLR
jgi:hypothetical protein